MERWGVRLKQTSDEKESAEKAKPHGEVDPITLFKLVMVASSSPWSEVPTYHGSLNAKELIDQINILDKYFDNEEVDEAKKVKFA